MTLSEYELLREANIAENQRTLDALGLVTSNKNMGSHLIPIISAPPREPRPYVKHVRFVDEDRVASLRKRVTHDIPRPNFYRDKRAMTRSRAREEASRVVIKKPRQPRASIGEGRVGGGAGGWNAGPYVGTAMMVQGRNSAGARRIALRQRPDGRLYGYFGRTQVAFRNGEMSLPCTLSGVTVLSYEDGGKLEEHE